MTERTHLFAGVAAALLIAQPKTRAELTCAIVGGALGGVFCDCDVKAASSRYAEMTAITLTAALMGVDWLTDGGVCLRIAERAGYACLGLTLLLILYLFGRRSEHRGRTHSFAYMALTSFSLALADMPLAAAFALGYSSHLALDLLNMQPEKLLYPYDKGVCINFCRADGFMNEVTFTLAVALSAGYMLMVML